MFLTLFRHDLHDVLIFAHVRDADSLWLVLGGATPNERVLEIFVHLAVDGVADVLDRAAVAHDQRLAEVRSLASRLRVHADKGQSLPDALQQNVQIQLLL